LDLPTAVVALIAVAVIAYIVTIVHAATTRTLGLQSETYRPEERLLAWPKWLFGLVGVLLVIWLLYRVRGILLPFLLGALIAYLLNPGIARLERKGWRRDRAILVVFGVFLALFVLAVVLLVPQFMTDANDLMQGYDHYAKASRQLWESLRETIVGWGQVVGMLPEEVRSAFSDLANAAQAYGHNVLRNIFGWLNRSVVIVSLLVITPVVTFWVLRDYQRLGQRLLRTVPEPRRRSLVEVLGEINKLVGSYLLGMATMMVIVGIFAIIVLTATGVPFSVLLGLMTGVLYVIPYIGFPAAMVVIALTMAVTDKGLAMILVTLGIMMVGNVAFDYGVQPRVIGRRVGLHPLVVIFSILAGASLLGFVGIVLAVPVAGSIKVVLLHFWPELFSSEGEVAQAGDAETG
jgi:predicted PurR-regulated permease PerM